MKFNLSEWARPNKELFHFMPLLGNCRSGLIPSLRVKNPPYLQSDSTDPFTCSNRTGSCTAMHKIVLKELMTTGNMEPGPIFNTGKSMVTFTLRIPIVLSRFLTFGNVRKRSMIRSQLPAVYKF